MSISNGKISLYVDAMLMETILGDSKLYKKGGDISDVLGKVKEYFGSKYDPEHPNASIINELAPGAVWTLFKAMGFGKWGILVGLLMSTFHVDVSGLLSSIYDKVKNLLSGGKKVSSDQIDQIVDSSVSAHAGEGQTALSSLDLMPQAKLIRLALVDYEAQLLKLTKEIPQLVSMGATSRAGGTSLLGKLFGLVIKIGLASAGFMIAGDAINHLIGRPNSLDKTYQAGKGTTPETVTNTTMSQTKYPLKENAPLPSSMPMQNNQQNIENMLIQFAKETYSGLDGKEQLIQQSPNFQGVVHQIASFNSHNQGSSQIFLPAFLTSKKQLVDYFIDDVAKNDQ